MRPVFLDSVTERRGRRRTDRSLRQQPEKSDEEVETSPARPEVQSTTLTGQHRITRRGL